MSVTIRLRRVGRKKQPSYRVVVIPSAAPRDGSYLDAIGFYNPRRRPRAELRLDLERLDYWVGQGAGMSDTVASLVRKARRGGDDSVELFPMSGPPPGTKAAPTPETEAEAEPAAAAAQAEQAASAPEPVAETAEEASASAPEPADASADDGGATDTAEASAEDAVESSAEAAEAATDAAPEAEGEAEEPKE